MSNLPSTQSELNKETVKHVTFMRDITGGTEHIHSKGETYLPKYNREDNEDYKSRLKNSELLPSTAEAISSMTGKLLLAQTTLKDVSERFRIKNIDNMGTSLQSFENTLTQTAIRDGLAFILVDMPRVEGVITQADAERVNANAYYVMVKADQIINFRTANINNEIKLSQVTIQMDTVEPVGEFGEDVVTKYHVYKNNNGIISLDIWGTSNDRGELIKEEENIIIKGVDSIPLVAFYTNKKYMFHSPSVLMEMAQLNLSWYRLNSALKRSIERSCDPTPVLKGQMPLDDNGQEREMSVGSSQMLIIDETSDFLWVGASSDVIKPTKDEIKDLETRMAKIATELLNDSEMTATEASISNTDTQAKLGTIATYRENALNRAYEYWKGFMNIQDNGIFQVNRDFSNVVYTNDQIVNLRNDYLAGMITKETYIKERQKGGELLSVEDIEKEIALAEDEQSLDNKETFNEVE